MTTRMKTNILYAIISWLLTGVVLAQANPLPVRLRGLNYNTRQGADWAPDEARCKSRKQIKTDLDLLHRITDRIRLLSITDCNQAEMVLEVAAEIGMEVYLGLWVDEAQTIWFREISAFEDLVIRGLVDPSVVIGVTVGSEVLLRQDAELRDLMEYVTQVRLLLATYGAPNLPVSIVEISYYYGLYRDLRDTSDTLYTNIFPYFIWQDTYNINGSVDQLIGDASQVINLASGTTPKKFILGETGWPSDGGREGLASPEHQVEYFVDFYCKVHLGKPDWDYFYFTGIDNAWRAAQGSLDVEGNWGFFTADDLVLKPHFQNLEFNCDGTTYSFGATDWTPNWPEESCKAHTMCAGIGGNCCPTSDGIFLGCCENAPTDAPTTSHPTTSPTKRPTRLPTPSPSRLPTPPTVSPTPMPTHREFCSAHSRCLAQGLTGTCCPTSYGPYGRWLGCCDNAPTTTVPPTQSPTTKSPTKSPTPSPTLPPTTSEPTTSSPTVTAPTTNLPTTLTPTASTPPPTAATPPPTTSPTKATAVPTTGSQPTIPTQLCLAHETCVQEGKFGLCCPDPQGIMLGCCSGDNIFANPTTAPVNPSANPTKSPTASPTKSPSEGQAQIPTPVSPVDSTTAPLSPAPTIIPPTSDPRPQGNIILPSPTPRPVALATGVSNAAAIYSYSLRSRVWGLVLVAIVPVFILG